MNEANAMVTDCSPDTRPHLDATDLSLQPTQTFSHGQGCLAVASGRDVNVPESHH